VTVSAPPRPPRRGDPVERDELEALVQALIEEARQRQRRRRQRYATAAVLAGLAAVVAVTVAQHTTASHDVASASSVTSIASAGASTSQIAFISVARSGEQVVYVMNADGSGKRRVTTHALTWPGVGVSDLTWSPDAREIAFSRGATHTDIYAAKVDGSGERRLTHGPARMKHAGGKPIHNGNPVWSPDGKKIAFARIGDQGIPTPETGLYVMNAYGSDQRRLARHNFGSGLWSPDGRKLAFLGFSPRRLNLYVINADGSGLRRLTRGSWVLFSWSPDGRRIAFVKRVRCDWKCSRNSELWLMNADGRGQRRVVQGQQISAAPTWSPDGQTLMYESSHRPSPSNPRLRYWWLSELFRVNVDGSGKRRLAYGAQPVWSPDGKQILFVGRRHSKADLWIMNTDGTGQRRLTATPGYGEHTFAWSPAQPRK
jgi:Tol biopolymer transport system component